MHRFIPLDLARTFAIILMVVYHTAYDLSRFYGFPIDVFAGGWKVLQLITATLFIGLVGVTAAIPYNRAPSQGAPTDIWKRAFKRFVRIGSAALLVTIATYMVNPETYVRFGVLHMIAVSALVMPLIQRWTGAPPGRPCVSIVIGIVIIGLNPWIPPPGFASVDYFPMIPWFGVVLVGYGIGHVMYDRLQHRRDVRIARLYGIHMKYITWPGRHSLLLYLIHQPIILGVLWMILGRPTV